MEKSGGSPAALTPRFATETDLAGLTGTLAAAFADDPLWGWGFPDPSKLAVWWSFLIQSALRYSWVWTTGDHSAVSVWIPPGGSELAADEEERAITLLDELTGDHAPAVVELIARFEAAHPPEPAHYYLSLLGVDPAQRGRGLGMALLADNLRRIDEAGKPAYLESSNPVNDARYAALGFVRAGEFSTPDGRHTVTTMWREPRHPGRG